MNLNYTSSSEVIASCAEQCDLDVVITSKAFVERFPNLAIPGRTLFLEDALHAPRSAEKLAALVLAWLAAQGLLRKALGTVRPKAGLLVSRESGNAEPAWIAGG